METLANDIFDAYREMYYEGGCSSVYFWDLNDDANFAACVLFKKDADQIKQMKVGNWDAIHVVEVRPGPLKNASYKLTSTIMLRLSTDHSVQQNPGTLNLSGSLTRQIEANREAKDNAAHVANMGSLIEDMENRMRDTLQAIYFGKTKTVVNGLYKASGSVSQKQKDELAKALQAELQGGRRS